jgi:hypothetical protein
MNHNNQNGLKASALLLGLSVEELIQILHNANSVKEIRTASGQPFILPAVWCEEKRSEVHLLDSQGRREPSAIPTLKENGDAKHK